MSTTDPTIKGYECKHVGYTTAGDGSRHDLLAIKEVVHYTDGRQEPRLRLIPDFKRPFWITHAMHQNHQDKKEWEDARKLERFESTQIDLPNRIAQAMGKIPTRYMRLREVCRSPYVYGADVTTAVLVKHHYMDRWPEVNGEKSSPYTVCNLDTETDVVHGTENIIMSSLAMGPKVHLRVDNAFLKGIIDPERKIREAFDRYLGEYKAKRGIELLIEFFDGEHAIAYHTVQGLHQWKPDWVAIWNIGFDIGKIEKALKKGGYDLGDVWADPSVPAPFRNYRFIEGPTQKVTQSGKTMPLPPSDQWHSVETPAMFQVLDAMSVYRKLRIAKGLEPGYGLDEVLQRNLGIRKLKFKEADHLVAGSLQWHHFMQSRYPVEYCVYNCFDTISMQELDDKTGDLSRQVGLHIGHSEMTRFPSQPRRTWDDMHFECLKHGKVAGTTSDKMRTEMDELTYDLRHWIVTLPSHTVADEGLQCVEEMPTFHSKFFSHVWDLDISGTYPTEQLIANISRETTSRELVAIEGLDERTQRSIGINLTGGHVNAVEICTRLYKAPTFDALLASYLASKGRTLEMALADTWGDEGGAGSEEDDTESDED